MVALVPPFSVDAVVSPDKARRLSRNKEYPKQLWYFLACFIFVIFLAQRLSTLLVWLTHCWSNGAEGRTNKRKGVSVARFPVAMVNLYRTVAFRWTINFGTAYSLNVAEVVMTAMYIAALLTWSFINTTGINGKKFTLSYYANRTGVLAASQIPLITCLGTKNNIIGLITGVGFEKLNYLHRMTARVLLILVWLHAGARIKAGLKRDLGEDWLSSGLLAGSSLSLLCILSLRPTRAKAYEFFFYTHFALAFMFVVGAYVHAAEFHFGQYVWPSFLIWGIDRLIRFARLVAFNVGSGTLDASTELVSENCVRLTVHQPSHFTWAPGQIAYLTMPGVSSLPFEAHPFTIGSVDPASLENNPLWRKGDPKDLVFIIHAKTGMTNRLLDVGAKGQKIKVFVDGPYGTSPNLDYFETIVLVAGGSGVTFTLPVLQNVVERVRSGRCDCRKLKFIWAIREFDHVNWIAQTLARTLPNSPPNLSVSVHIHVTKSGIPELSTPGLDKELTPADFDEGSELSEKKDDNPDMPSTATSTNMRDLLSMDRVLLNVGRPDVKALLIEAAREASGRMNVSVCGQGIVRSVRAALRSQELSAGSVLRGGPDVSLHVEAFGYA